MNKIIQQIIKPQKVQFSKQIHFYIQGQTDVFTIIVRTKINKCKINNPANKKPSNQQTG